MGQNYKKFSFEHLATLFLTCFMSENKAPSMLEIRHGFTGNPSWLQQKFVTVLGGIDHHFWEICVMAICLSRKSCEVSTRGSPGWTSKLDKELNTKLSPEVDGLI